MKMSKLKNVLNCHLSPRYRKPKSGLLLRIIAEFMSLTSDECKPMQKALYVISERHSIGGIRLKYINNDSVLKYPVYVYPHVNEQSEFTRGPLNRQVEEVIFSQREKGRLTLEDCSQFILGDFCIISPLKTWAISTDLDMFAKCQHENIERSVAKSSIQQLLL